MKPASFFPVRQARLASALLASITLFGATAASAKNAALETAFRALPAGDPATQICLLAGNENAWYTRWKMIESAKHSIDATYFIVSKDVFGQAFLGHLFKRAREGVKVRLMIDWRIAYSSYMKGVYDKLQEMARHPNVKIRLYNSAIKELLKIFSDPKALVASNHDKIMIIDGEVALTGGRNIGADYFGGRGEGEIIYRDTDVLLRSKAVSVALKKAFDLEWAFPKNSTVEKDLVNVVSQKETLDFAYTLMSKYLVKEPLPALGSAAFVSSLVHHRKEKEEMAKEINRYSHLSRYKGFQLCPNGPRLPVKIVDKTSTAPTRELDAIGPMLLKMIEASRSEIVIQNPYVVLTAQAEGALSRAAKRGVKILFHSNSGGSTDNLYPQAFLMEDMVRIFKAMPGVRFMAARDANSRLHSKTFVFDRQVVVIGSFNMDPLSAQVNSEIVSVMHDDHFGNKVRNYIQNDIKKGAIEYRVTFDGAGKVKEYYGPENHLSKDVLEKMKKIQRYKLLRPVI